MNTTLKPCPFCNTLIPEECIYCDNCGEKLRKCTSCGAFAKSKRCTRCGKPTEEVSTKPTQSNVQSAAPSTPPTPLDTTPAATIVSPISPNISASSSSTSTLRPNSNINANAERKPDHLVCLSAPLRLGLCHDAIIGRRGSYGNVFQNFLSISGLHAKLIDTGNGWQIEDIGSSYGTFLNGTPLEKNRPTPIRVGDIIRFADIDFKVTE